MINSVISDELDLIESWDEIIENFQNFNSSIEISNSVAQERLERFFHWYYFPLLDIFAPSKFLGYKGMTLFTYKGEGDGRETQPALKKYFIKLDRDSQKYNELFTKLKIFLKSMGKEVSKKTTSGSGGIYIPKIEYDTKLLINQELLDKVTKDMDSMEEENNGTFSEGSKKERLVRIYERNPALRAKAIEIHGFTCQVCDFNFGKSYGKHGENYIEVHHITPLSALIKEKEINPKTDLAVLCSNCHRMIHRDKNNPLNIVDLRNLLNKSMAQVHEND